MTSNEINNAVEVICANVKSNSQVQIHFGSNYTCDVDANEFVKLVRAGKVFDYWREIMVFDDTHCGFKELLVAGFSSINSIRIRY